MARRPIDFGGEPPFKQGAYVHLDHGERKLTLSEHEHDCFDEPLVIPLQRLQGGLVWKGEYAEKPGQDCEEMSWTVYVFRIAGRLYGTHFPTPTEASPVRTRQSSGVWGADEAP